MSAQSEDTLSTGVLYGDVTVHVQRDILVGAEMEIKLRRYKNSPLREQQPILVIHSMDSRTSPILDSIVQLLLLAEFDGNLRYGTVEQELQHAASNGGIIQWTDPSFPLLGQYQDPSQPLVAQPLVTQPLVDHTDGQNSLHDMTLETGCAIPLHLIQLHAIRRGFCRDLTLLQQSTLSQLALSIVSSRS